MFLYGAIACVLIAGVISETDTGNPLPVPTVNFHGRRTVRRSAPQLTAISEKDIFRSADDEPKRIYRQADLSYASYGGTPPWNYGNQQEKENSHGGQPSHPSSGYYPTQGGNGQQPDSEYRPTQPELPQPGYPQPPQTGSPQPVQPTQPGQPQRPQPGSPQPGYPQRPQPGSPQPGYPQRPQPGSSQPSLPGSPHPEYPQRPQPGYPQRPQPGTPQPTQPGYPQRPYPGATQPGYPQRPQPGSTQPGYPQRPQPGSPLPTQPGYPQRPQPGFPQPTQPGRPQRPQPGYPQTGYPQPGYPQPGQPTQPQYPGTSQPQRPTGPQTSSSQGPPPPGSHPSYPQKPPSNEIYPGHPFYPQIQPGLTGPPEGELEPNEELLKYCKASRGQFAVEHSCKKYINCWDDVAVEQVCAGNLLFNEEKKYCDFPENVNCGSRPMTSMEEKGPAAVQEGNCMTPFSTYRGSTNCGEFFVCSHGVPSRFVCPGGLAYNPDLGVCDYVERVDCNGVPVLPVEETTDEFDYQGEMENSSNEDYYGGFGSQGNKPYGKKKIDDEDDSQSTLIKNIS